MHDKVINRIKRQIQALTRVPPEYATQHLDDHHELYAQKFHPNFKEYRHDNKTR